MGMNADAGVRFVTATPVASNFANADGPPLVWDWSNGALYGIKNDGSVTRIPSIALTGSAAPAVTPSYIGQFFVDTSARKLYFSVGTASSADWEIAN